jgi:hypothetical protein
LDRLADDLRGGDMSALEKVGNFLTTSIFLNPLIHVPNIAVHWAVEKGMGGLGVLRAAASKDSRIAAVKAINAVVHQNKDFVYALRQGAPLQSHRQELQEMQRLLFQKLGHEMLEDQTIGKKVAGALGYANPIQMVKGWYKLSGRVTWVSNDIAFLQAAYEKVARGMSMQDAITETAKHIPSYRIPTRVLDSPALSKLMRNRLLTMFTAYHYGALKSYGEAIKSATGSSERPYGGDRGSDVRHGWDILASIGAITFLLYPLADAALRKITGDDKARLRRAGAATFPFNIYQLSEGERSPSDVIQSVFTPSVIGKKGLELAFNRDTWAGRKVYDPHAPAKTIAWQLGRFAGSALAPVDQATRASEREDGWKKAGWSMVGVSFPASGAEKRAMEILAGKRGGAAPTPESVHHSATMSDMRDAARRGDTARLVDAVHDREITPKQYMGIMKDARRDPLVGMTKNFDFDELLSVYGQANQQQRDVLRQELVRKYNTEIRRTADPDKQELKDRLNGALTSPPKSVLPPFLRAKSAAVHR